MSLTLHRDMHSGKTKCPVCERAFSRVHDMRTHVQKKHFKMTMNFDSRATIVATTTTTTTMSRSGEEGGTGSADTQTSNSSCGGSNRLAATSATTPLRPPSPLRDKAAVSSSDPGRPSAIASSTNRPEITVKLSHSGDGSSDEENELIIVTSKKQ